MYKIASFKNNDYHVYHKQDSSITWHSSLVSSFYNRTMKENIGILLNECKNTLYFIIRKFIVVIENTKFITDSVLWNNKVTV